MDDSKVLSAVLNTVLIGVMEISDGLFNENNKREILASCQNLLEVGSGERAKRKKYDHEQAHFCIMRDYLGPEPLFGDGEF